MPSTKFDVNSLSDEELYQSLKDFGEDIGPIVATTRKVYRNKLMKLMSSADEPDFTHTEPGFTYTDNDQHDEILTSTTKEHTENGLTRSPAKSKVAQPAPSSPTTRQRTKKRDIEYEDRAVAGPSRPTLMASSLSFNHNEHTPSPRPSLRSVLSSKTTEYSSTYNNLRESNIFRETYRPKEKMTVKEEKPSFVIRLLVKLVIIVIIALVLYLSYQYVYSESPLKELENLARETLASLKDEETKAPKMKVKSSAK